MKRNINFVILNWLAVILTIWVLEIFSSNSHAYTEIAVSVPIQGENLQDGYIVCYKDGDYKLSSTPFDLTMFGVIVSNPVAAFEETVEPEKYKLILTSGEAYVRVSDKNGTIKKGDYVTSSDSPGLGMKAVNNGHVLGVALEDVGDDNMVPVYIDIRINYISAAGARGNIFEFLKSGYDAAYMSPLSSLRYILAALIVVGSFLLGFFSFGRMSNRSIEAIGRNPLAKGSIRRIVLFNFFLTFLIIAAGIGIAYLVLIL